MRPPAAGVVARHGPSETPTSGGLRNTPWVAVLLARHQRVCGVGARGCELHKRDGSGATLGRFLLSWAVSGGSLPLRQQAPRAKPNVMDEPPSRLPWAQRHTPMRGTRRARNWKRLMVGERIRNKHGQLTSWRLLEEPWSSGKGSMCRVRVECLECNRALDRRLNDIIQGTSSRCPAFALRRRRTKAVPSD